MLAIKELLGSKLKFGLIALAIGLVVSLTMITSAISEGLIRGMSGAKNEIAADAVAFQRDTFPILERSVVSADDIAALAEAPGVARAYGVGHSFATVGSADDAYDARVFGLGDRIDQLPIVEGTGEIGPGEAVADASAAWWGAEVGDTVTLTPTGIELAIVGFTEGRRYVMFPTLWVDLPTWEAIHVATILGRVDGGEDGAAAAERMAAQFAGGASVAALEFEPGVSLAEVQQALGDEFTLATTEDAALAGNGMPEMILAVGGIQVVSVVIGALLVGVFFYITTLHKTAQIAAIKAIGASNAHLYRTLIVQITVLVAVATVIGTALALAAGAGMPPLMAFDPDPARWATAIAAVFGTAYLGSLFSLKSILGIDPATALGRTST